VHPVFIVEGGTGVGEVAQHHLELGGFAVRVLSIGNNVIQRAERARPALVMIDAMAPGDSGLQLCSRIRGTLSLVKTPVILLGVETSVEERIAGLESGADDYITGILSTQEFMARVRAVIRRFARTASLRSGHSFGFPASLAMGPIRTGDIELDPSAMKILVRGGEVETTSLEFRLMYYLTHFRSRVFSRDELLDAVWGMQYANPRCVDACVRRLRRKIEPNLARPTYLKTVRGAGYCLRA
jgi:two-component system, OmpR family, alkaline phosphatase synthesis response regulator PhoP